MPNYSRNEVILVRYPFSDLTNFKVRPAVVVNTAHSSSDLFVVPLTSKTDNLVNGEFVLTNWKLAGLNVESSVKRAVFTIHKKLVLKSVGRLTERDIDTLDHSLREWIGLV